MKYSIENNLLETQTGIFIDQPTIVGAESSNILDSNTIKTVAFQNGKCKIGIEFEPTSFDLVAIFNIVIKDYLYINLYVDKNESPVDSFIISKNDLTGIENLSTAIEISSSNNDIENIYNDGAFFGTETGFGSFGFGDVNDQPITVDYSYIELETKSSDTSFVTEYGYIWIGNTVDLGCIENIQVKDNSNDSATVTKANTIESNRSYSYRSYQATIGKHFDFTGLRTKIRPILSTGYATPRPFYFDESYMNGELVYGHLDNGSIGYDIIQQNENDNYAQTTIGIREVN